MSASVSKKQTLSIPIVQMPDDIYKTHLEPTRIGSGLSGGQDSARVNLAAAYVSALVNCGYHEENLSKQSGWLDKHKDHSEFHSAIF